MRLKVAGSMLINAGHKSQERRFTSTVMTNQGNRPPPNSKINII